jgi:hypothetical protein
LYFNYFPGGFPMKRFLLALVLIGLASTCVLAQQDDEPPIPPRRSKAARFGAFAGFTPGWLFVDVNPINDFLVSTGAAALKDNGMYLWGGGGAAYIMLVPNLRVGGMGMGGTIKSTSVDAFGTRRDAELHVGVGGVTLEYVIPVVERLDVSIGTMLGGGGIDITWRQDNGGIHTWTGEGGTLKDGGPFTQVKRTYSGSYFVWIPSVNVEYAILGWLGARVGASYMGMSAPSWTVDDNYELLGVPSNVSGKGFMINAGVFVGTF